MKRFILILIILILMGGVFVLVFQSTIKREVKNLVGLFEGGNLSNIECVDSIPSNRIFFYSDSLKIMGDQYLPHESSNTPFILILHGSSVYGRKLPLIQILANQFRRLRYTVLAIDSRGYGESQDPETFTSPKDFDFGRDVVDALNYIINTAQLEIDTSKIFVIGHSFGAGVALAAQNRDRRIRKVVLIGPPRRLSERVFGPDATETERFLSRWQQDMGLSYPLHFSIWKNVYKSLDIKNYCNDSLYPKNVPFLLVDGEKESPEDREFLTDIYDCLASPKEYWTVAETGHYLSTGFIKERICYNSEVITRFVEKTNVWLLADEISTFSMN